MDEEMQYSVIVLIPISGVEAQGFAGKADDGTAETVEKQSSGSRSSAGTAWDIASTRRGRDSCTSQRFMIQCADTESVDDAQSGQSAAKLVQGKHPYILLMKKFAAPRSLVTTKMIEDQCRQWSEKEVGRILPEVLMSDSAGIKWISRTLVVDDKDVIPKDWLHSRSLQLSPETIAALRCREAYVGWGNNVIVGAAGSIDRMSAFMCHREDNEAVRLFIDGLVDAQSFWIEAEALAKDAVMMVLEQRDDEDKGQDIGEESENVLSNLAYLNALYNDYDMSTQGIRHDVAHTQLKAWNYYDLCSSIGERLHDAEGLHKRKQQKKDAHYHHLVEIILYALGSLSVISLALDFYQTALSGNVDMAPQGIVAAFVQCFGLDNSVLLSLIIIVLLIMLYIRANRDE